MPTVDFDKILVGYGDLYYASVGTALPTFASGETSLKDAFDGDADWNYVGATQDGVELSYQPDYGEVEVDQVMGPAKFFQQNLTLNASTNLAEATLENLLVAWNYADSALVTNGDVDTFTIGTPNVNPIERAIAIVSQGVETDADNTTPDQARERIYHGFRVVSAEGSTLALRRTEGTVYPITFRLLPNNDREYGEVIERVPGDTA